MLDSVSPLSTKNLAFSVVRNAEIILRTSKKQGKDPNETTVFETLRITVFFLRAQPIFQVTMATHAAMDDHSATSSSDDDSDDDFLTTLNPEGGEDREALVRRKLLQNFYGKSAVAAEDEASVPHRSRPRGAHKSSDATATTVGGNTDDLDSPQFDAVQHAVRHIRSDTAHELLETEEKLALSVRTLDSTMQTLVYENYSRFIDATDAVGNNKIDTNFLNC